MICRLSKFIFIDSTDKLDSFFISESWLILHQNLLIILLG